MMRSEEGFTLVEMLVSLGILMIVTAGLDAMLVTAIRARVNARQTTAATVLAQDKVEAIRTLPVASVSSGTDQVTYAGTTSTYSRSRQAASARCGSGNSLARR